MLRTETVRRVVMKILFGLLGLLLSYQSNYDDKCVLTACSLDSSCSPVADSSCSPVANSSGSPAAPIVLAVESLYEPKLVGVPPRSILMNIITACSLPRIHTTARL